MQSIAEVSKKPKKRTQSPEYDSDNLWDATSSEEEEESEEGTITSPQLGSILNRQL